MSMTAMIDRRQRWDADACARLVMTHRIDRELVARAIGSGLVERLLAGEPIGLDPEKEKRLSLLLNILIRLEVRLRGDSRLIREALVTPLTALGGATPADTMTNLAGLRAVRNAIADMPVPAIRMWRCPSGYG